MLKSVNRWSFPPELPLEDVLYHTQKAGYDAIELNLESEGHIDGLTYESTVAEVEKVGNEEESREV